MFDQFLEKLDCVVSKIFKENLFTAKLSNPEHFTPPVRV